MHFWPLVGLGVLFLLVIIVLAFYFVPRILPGGTMSEEAEKELARQMMMGIDP